MLRDMQFLRLLSTYASFNDIMTEQRFSLQNVLRYGVPRTSDAL